MSFTNTQKRCLLVLDRMIKMAKDEPEDLMMFAEMLDTPEGGWTVENAMLLLATLRKEAASGQDLEQLATRLEVALSELASNDAFGTEMQCDPRGDGRNGHWSMKNVEGVDD